MTFIAEDATARRSAPEAMGSMGENCANSKLINPCEQQETRSQNEAAQQMQHLKCI
jgi:hypothetical protein